MKCQAVSNNLIAYLDGELPQHERAAIAEHLAVCADCRREAAAFGHAEDALRALNVVEAAPDLTADLHQRIAARVVRALSWKWAYGVAAAAAVSAALLFLLYPRAPSTHRISPPLDIAAQPTTAEPKVPPPVPPPATRQAPPQTVIAQEWRPGAAPKRRPSRSRPVRHRVARHPLPPATETSPPDVSPAETFWDEPAEAQAVELPVGIILILGTPEPAPPSSSCYIEVSLPDGTKSIRKQDVQRDADGNPRAIQIAYEHVAPEAPGPNQGG